MSHAPLWGVTELAPPREVPRASERLARRRTARETICPRASAPSVIRGATERRSRAGPSSGSSSSSKVQRLASTRTTPESGSARNTSASRARPSALTRAPRETRRTWSSGGLAGLVGAEEVAGGELAPAGHGAGAGLEAGEEGGHVGGAVAGALGAVGLDGELQVVDQRRRPDEARAREVIPDGREAGRDLGLEAGDALGDHGGGEGYRLVERGEIEGGRRATAAELHRAGRRVGAPDLALPEGPGGHGDVLAGGGERAVAAGIGEVPRHVEAHRAGGEAGGGDLAGVELDDHPGAHQGPGPLDHALAQRGLERGVGETRGGPALRRRRGGEGRGGALGVPGRVSEGHGDAVAAHGHGAAGAGRLAQGLARDEPGDGPVLEAAGDHGGLVLGELGALARRDLALRALDQAEVGDRGQALGRERQEIGAAHARTFSAIQPTSSPGVMAPTWAPACTRRRARSLS